IEKSDINELRNMMASYFQKGNAYTLGSGSLPSNIIANPRGDLKAITTRSGVSYDRPPIPRPTSSLPKEVEWVPDVTKDTEQLSTENIQHPMAQTQVLIDEPIVAQKLKPTIPYPSRANKKSSKLFDLATTPVNENCSAIIIKKLPEKFRDPGKFLIPCDFPELDECLALSDLGASINLMPLSIWRKFSLRELTSTQMILELADRSATQPAGIAEDVFVKVGKFYFSINFVVVDYLVDPRSVNPTPTSDPIISSSTSFTPFEGSDIIMEEIETFLQTLDEFYNLDDDYYDMEEDILYLEELLNEDPYPNLPLVKTKDLKQVDATMTKPSIEEPPE
nr:hypothetical protein [Tanacetum cinerariifolium]